MNAGLDLAAATGTIQPAWLTPAIRSAPDRSQRGSAETGRQPPCRPQILKDPQAIGGADEHELARGLADAALVVTERREATHRNPPTESGTSLSTASRAVTEDDGGHSTGSRRQIETITQAHVAVDEETALRPGSTRLRRRRRDRAARQAHESDRNPDHSGGHLAFGPRRTETRQVAGKSLKSEVRWWRKRSLATTRPAPEIVARRIGGNALYPRAASLRR